MKVVRSLVRGSSLIARKTESFVQIAADSGFAVIETETGSWQPEKSHIAPWMIQEGSASLGESMDGTKNLMLDAGEGVEQLMRRLVCARRITYFRILEDRRAQYSTKPNAMSASPKQIQERLNWANEQVKRRRRMVSPQTWSAGVEHNEMIDTRTFRGVSYRSSSIENTDGWIVATSGLPIFQNRTSWGLCAEETEGVGSELSTNAGSSNVERQRPLPMAGIDKLYCCAGMSDIGQ